MYDKRDPIWWIMGVVVLMALLAWLMVAPFARQKQEIIDEYPIGTIVKHRVTDEKGVVVYHGHNGVSVRFHTERNGYQLVYCKIEEIKGGRNEDKRSH